MRDALSRFEQTNEPYCGSTDPRAAGNGSIMRLAPVPLFFCSDPVKAIETAALSSRTTHGTATCVDACRYLAALLVGILQGQSKDEILSAGFTPVPGYWEQKPLVAEIEEISSGSFNRKKPPAIRGSGYVVQSLEAALWAFYHGKCFKDGLLMAVNLGDDADTTGAVYGQIAGAYYGEQAIPAEWLDKLAYRATIESFADKLLGLGGRIS